MMNDLYMPPQQKGFRAFYLFPILYVLSWYWLPVSWFVDLKTLGDMQIYLQLLPFILGIINIIVSVVFCKPHNRVMFFNTIIWVKYALVPLFVAGFAIMLLTLPMAFMPFPAMIIAVPFMELVFLVLGWLIVAFSAPYAIAYLRLSQKAGLRTKGAMVAHSFCQFFFVADVIDVMCLTIKERRWRKITIVFLVLFVLAVIGGIVYGTVGLLKAILEEMLTI